MGTLSPDQARELLGGSARLNGQSLLAGRANHDGMTLVTVPRRSWSWRRQDPGERQPRQARPGSRLITAGTLLLFAAIAGLLGVSYAAQYSYILGQRHQHVASLIEAGALDVLLIIFSLLALGLARAGLPAKTERALVLVFAAGSALMNYAAADVTSPRSVAAYVMPPVALAIVMFYSFTKRFTSLSHLVLGFSLGIAPAAAWIAVRGSLDPRILWLTAAVTLWTAGFDIIYACQDYSFDIEAGLYSIPKRFGIAGGLVIARVLHVGMLICLIALERAFSLGIVAALGIAAVAGLLAWEHRLVKADDLSRIDAAFFTMNGYISVLFFVFWAAAIFWPRNLFG